MFKIKVSYSSGISAYPSFKVKASLGFITGLFFDAGDLNHVELDTIDSDMEGMYYPLQDLADSHLDFVKYKIIIIDRMFVKSNFRGKGIGTSLLKALINHFENIHGPCIFILQAAPYELNPKDTQYSKEKKKLNHFYKNNGFKKLKMHHQFYILITQGPKGVL